MARIKDKPKIVHRATTLEYLYCLSDMPKWSQVLLEQNNIKAYNKFLKWILEKQYFKNEEKISIKKIAEISGYSSIKISKWLREIYEDILKLNELQPKLYCLPGNVQVEFHFKYFDNHGSFTTSLAAIPRIYETVDFFFIKAKIGSSSFWVKDVRHILGEDKTYVLIILSGTSLNIYREFALSKALFEGTINFMDVYHKYEFEIDEHLLKRR